MIEREVRFTETARRQVHREKTWWLGNRDHTETFSMEVESAIRILKILPGAGTKQERANIVGLRRIYLEKIGCHLYYTFDDRTVTIRALWGARKQRGPRLVK